LLEAAVNFCPKGTSRKVRKKLEFENPGSPFLTKLAKRGKSATVLIKWALDAGSDWVQHMLRRGC